MSVKQGCTPVRKGCHTLKYDIILLVPPVFVKIMLRPSPLLRGHIHHFPLLIIEYFVLFYEKQEEVLEIYEL